jgi:hypothetical protein
VKIRVAALIALSTLVLGATVVQAHSASDTYLSLTVDSGNRRGVFVVHGQWDIALRDLDFVLKLDDDGDGRLSWGEVKHHQAAIERYAYASLGFSGNPGEACVIKPTRQLIDDHADGAYAALFFDVVCRQAPLELHLKYKLFFAIDPSHRGIFVMHDGANIATAVLSPQNDVIDLTI